ncbi:hypothetical protein ES692_11410 [Psychroserpens burtonensis]|uniref:Uncharacterized protein n=1 Tax=Psychroserpens burtonensis TaxID=49278 RepID=A0A5C7BA80_9FLAO|nr:hypothetical protein [Psychroserpens burtonensis]TXE16951.1 hypothetical protein ES692_11410 [Psychroserpens burtonensis]
MKTLKIKIVKAKILTTIVIGLFTLFSVKAQEENFVVLIGNMEHQVESVVLFNKESFKTLPEKYLVYVLTPIKQEYSFKFR